MGEEDAEELHAGVATGPEDGGFDLFHGGFHLMDFGACQCAIRMVVSGDNGNGPWRSLVARLPGGQEAEVRIPLARPFFPLFYKGFSRVSGNVPRLFRW